MVCKFTRIFVWVLIVQECISDTRDSWGGRGGVGLRCCWWWCVLLPLKVATAAVVGGVVVHDVIRCMLVSPILRSSSDSTHTTVVQAVCSKVAVSSINPC